MSDLVSSRSVLAAASAVAKSEDTRLRRLRFFFAFLRARPSFAVGYAIVAIIIIVAVFAPWLAPYGPMTADPTVYLLPPGGSHLLGTDGAGMDIFSRVVFAPRVDLAIAIIGTLMSATIGGVIGAVVGYYEGQRAWRRAISTLVMRSADVLQAFPVFVFAIALVAVFGQSVKSIILAIAFVNTPIYLRLMRIQVLSVSKLRYVEAAYVAGASDVAILRRHVIPNAVAPLLAQLSVNIGWSVLLTAGLSFVGAGVVAPTPEWGSMIAMGFQNIVTGQWWPSVFPGIALVHHRTRLRTRRRQRRSAGRSGTPPSAIGFPELTMLLLRYIARRIPYVIPQLFGIILVSFFMVKLIPGDPAVMMLGPMASEQSLTALAREDGLEQAAMAAILVLHPRRHPRRLRYLLADDEAGNRGFVSTLPGDLGTGDLRAAAGAHHRLSPRRRGGAPSLRACPQIR